MLSGAPLWFLGTLVPGIGIVQVGGQAMADRYTYTPIIGLFIAFTWGLWSLAYGWDIPKKVVLALTFSIVLGLAICSWHQVAHWKDNIALFQHALRVTKDNQLAHNQLGLALTKEGRVEEAIKHFSEALRIDPKSVWAQKNLNQATKRPCR